MTGLQRNKIQDKITKSNKIQSIRLKFKTDGLNRFFSLPMPVNCSSLLSYSIYYFPHRTLAHRDGYDKKRIQRNERGNIELEIVNYAPRAEMTSLRAEVRNYLRRCNYVFEPELRAEFCLGL